MSKVTEEVLAKLVDGEIIDGKSACPECIRVFNLYNSEDAEEYYYGHDCEALGFEVSLPFSKPDPIVVAEVRREFQAVLRRAGESHKCIALVDGDAECFTCNKPL
jgi:hypothetical protein